ncbi:MAG: phosphodiester glycosidase family protein [Clostridia bacterium]|nr:phosphodiester glycosidase family protein [Clostridia bacterium]
MVGIDGEEELKAEQLKNNSFEARRARNVQTLGSGAFNEDKDSLQNANRQILNSRATTQKTTVSNTRPSIERTQAPKSVQRNSGSDIRNRSLNNRPQQKNSTSSQRNTTATVEKIQNERKEKEKEAKTNKLIKVLTACVISIALIISMYAVVIFGNIPFVTKWRNIWIETAMTTDQHKWLATCFFPKYLIDEIMDAQVDVTDIGKTDINKEDEKPDILGQKDLVVGELDSHGNEVLINDIEQGIVVLKVKTSNYVGRLVLIDDPSRVYITATDYKNSRGEFICDYLEKEDAVIGMNASGFHDPGGTSVGGVVTAQCIAQGEYWGTYSSKYITVGFDKDDRLVVGEFSDWEEHNMRDAFQYHPALIINGDKVIEGSSGWGLQPRSVIGQAENGVVMFFVVDGRQVGYSLGATMGDCADVLEEYGAVNAGACDGGSSSVLAYEGEILNEPSTNMPTGRYLPNAWVVARKTTELTQTTN